MELLKEYSEKYGVKEIVNSMGEHRKTRDNSIIFPNGWVASVVPNEGVTIMLFQYFNKTSENYHLSIG